MLFLGRLGVFFVLWSIAHLNEIIVGLLRILLILWIIFRIVDSWIINFLILVVMFEYFIWYQLHEVIVLSLNDKVLRKRLSTNCRLVIDCWLVWNHCWFLCHLNFLLSYLCWFLNYSFMVFGCNDPSLVRDELNDFYWDIL